MASLTKNHTIKKKVTFEGIADDGGDAEFLVTFKSLPDQELHETLIAWKLGSGDEIAATQRAGLDKFVLAAECKKFFPTDADALAFLKDGSAPVRAALLAAYQGIMGGSILQKN